MRRTDQSLTYTQLSDQWEPVYSYSWETRILNLLLSPAASNARSSSRCTRSTASVALSALQCQQENDANVKWWNSCTTRHPMPSRATTATIWERLVSIGEWANMNHHPLKMRINKCLKWVASELWRSIKIQELHLFKVFLIKPYLLISFTGKFN